MAMLPNQHAKNQHAKNAPFFPAGYAVAYQLTGDKAHAEKAKELLTGMLDLRGSQDIHYGPMANGSKLQILRVAGGVQNLKVTLAGANRTLLHSPILPEAALPFAFCSLGRSAPLGLG